MISRTEAGSLLSRAARHACAHWRERERRESGIARERERGREGERERERQTGVDAWMHGCVDV